MWQRFTERARRVIFFSQEEAGRLGENYVSTEHLLLGLVRENDSVAARILDRMGVSLGRIRNEVERHLTKGDGRLGQDMQLTPRAKRVVDLAYDEARQLSNNYIGTEHLLLGLIREDDGLAGRVLRSLGVDLDRTRREVMVLQDSDGPQSPNPAPRRTPDTSNPTAQLTPKFWARRLAFQFEMLPRDLQTSLENEGVEFHRVPEPLADIVRRLFGIMKDPEQDSDGITHTRVIDPNGRLLVRRLQVAGATQYSIAITASLVTNWVVPTPPQASVEPEADSDVTETSASEASSSQTPSSSSDREDSDNTDSDNRDKESE